MCIFVLYQKKYLSMSKIKNVEIKSFWNDKIVKLSLNEDVNFLIGVNGSGKTTIINLIAAVINADIRALNRALFSEIKIDLYADKRRTAYIIVSKNIENDSSPYFDIVYKIKDYTDKSAIEFSFNTFDEDRRVRAEFHNGHMIHSSMQRRVRLDIFDKLKQMINLSWISVNRNSLLRKDEDRDSDISIDKVLINLNNEIKSYFSVLNNKANEETKNFQQYIFSSLLDTEFDVQNIIESIASDLNKEKESLVDIYKLFNMFNANIKKKLNRQYDEIENIKNNLDNGEIKFEHFSYIFNLRKTHSIVEEWQNLNATQSKIFEKRDVFLNVINNLLQRKELIVNEKNELEVKTESGKLFSLNTLSSGEKQLLLILANGLLQENEHYIYIADEPELSLHIEWQEQLVSSLKQVSPTSQIIFATHSPDIVGRYSSSVINIEKVIYEQ